jgi:methyl-accepting chemotaxis protein
MKAEDDLDQRLDFLNLKSETQQRLRAVKPVVMKALPAALDAFYAQVQSRSEISQLFASASAMAEAKNRQIGHWEAIASGQFDRGYVRNVTAVGQAHARVGLTPRWYIGGYALLLDALVGAVIEARWPKGGLLSGRGPAAAEVKAEAGALIRAALLDMDYAVSVYVEEVEEARLKTKHDVLAEERAAVVASVGDGMSHLSAGDLTHRMSDAIPAEYRRLRDDFNTAMDKLQQTMVTIAAGASGISMSAQEIAEASDDLSRHTEQQAASLEQTAAALDEITTAVKKTAGGARQASEAVSAAKGVAEQSGAVVSEAVQAMGQIETSSKQISQIIGVIDEIAFQTNLLALNAGVEAARAGDAGRGFAVVAQEVRALAQRSAEAAKEIKALISASSRQVSHGVHLVGETGEALGSIVAKVGEIDLLVSDISASAQEQASSLAEVNTAMNQMDQVVQQNAAMVEESTAASHSLKSETQELARLIAGFTTAEAPASTDRGVSRSSAAA